MTFLRKAIEAHDGFLFKRTGDGVCAVFASPRAAVAAAGEAQRALELPVRMGNTAQIRAALGILASFLDHYGHHEPAAVIAGYASLDPTPAPTVPEFGIAVAHLREVLGAQAYESLSRKGEVMTMAAVVTFANDSMDEARRQLVKSG